jgi:hypothetical protein
VVGEEWNPQILVNLPVTNVLSRANQPTKKLPKGGVLLKRQISSLARFYHSCERNALLEMVKGALKL